MVVDVNYDAGIVVVRDAVWPGTGKEYRTDSISERVQAQLKADGHLAARVFNETPALVAWIERSTKKPFRRPTGEFVFRVVGEGIGRGDISEWPE